MARINTYQKDTEISLNDKLLGTDKDDSLKTTKNYTIESIKNFILDGVDVNSQNNILFSVNLNPIYFPNANTNVLIDASNLINQLNNFVVSSVEIPIFNLIRGEKFYVLSFQGIGKGTYGIGTEPLGQENLQIISEKPLNLNSILELSNTSEINLFNIGSLEVNDVVNLINPAIEIQPLINGFTIFKAIQNNTPKNWLYLGDSGLVGLNEYQTKTSDFNEIVDFSIINHSELNLNDGTNPHGTTKIDVGLGNVDNTADLDKPVSNATQTALNNKYDASNPLGFETPTELNARDAANRSRNNHTGTQDASTITGLGVVATSNDYNDLDNLPDLSALAQTVEQYANLADFPVTGVDTVLYIAKDTGFMYRWTGSVYVQLTDQTAVWGSISGTLSNQSDLDIALNGKESLITAGTISQYYRGDKTFQTLDKTAVGLDNVDNTSDADKPISNLTQIALDSIELRGSQYIYVYAKGTDVQNAQELQNAYNEAKTMFPSVSNRITIIAAPANYNFETSVFEMDTEYIDLVSLNGNRSIVFNASLNTSDPTEGSINITANDVFVKGVDVGTKNFAIGDNLNLLKVENCKGGNFSFGGDPTLGSNPLNVSGTFIDCEGGEFSFGRGGTASGTFVNCQCTGRSFGADGIASGMFNNCISVFGADFGAFGTASGTFVNCESGAFSFGGGGISSGTFTNCVGGSQSFGSGSTATASGTFINCQGGGNSFGGFTTTSGTFKDCIGGFGSFGGNGGTASGTFTNCVGGNFAFGGNNGTLSGKVYYCRLTDGIFQTPTGTGKIVLGIDGNDDVINLTA